MNVLERLSVLEERQAKTEAMVAAEIKGLWSTTAGWHDKLCDSVEALTAIIGVDLNTNVGANPRPAEEVRHENGCVAAPTSSTTALAALQDNLVEILGVLRGLSEGLAKLTKPVIDREPPARKRSRR